MMFSQKFFNKQRSVFVALAVVVSVAAVAGFVYAATTIGTNVSVDGNLTISGTSATTTFSTGGFTVGTNQFVVQQTSGRVGIGTTAPSAKLDISAGNIALDNTTNTNQFGVISKAGTRFIHDFNYGNNGTVTTDGYNTFIGFSAGNLTMGSTATAGGESSYNTAVGAFALLSITRGYYNTGVGDYALDGITTGGYNGALGHGAGSYIANGVGANTTSNSSLYLGYDTRALASGDTNEIVIGDSAIGLGSNTVVLGNSSITKTALRGNIGIGTTTPYSKFHVSQGASATTTVNFGEVGSATSKACFNTKNVSGADISFYFSAANTLVIENNLCR